MLAVDWAKVFMPDTPIPEIVARGLLTYVALFVVLRIVLKRQAAGLGVTDLLVVVLIADAAQNGMAGSYQSIPDGLVLVATIVVAAYLMDWLGYRFTFFERLLKPNRLPLVEHGRLLVDNMRRELVTRDELFSQLREQGIADLAHVRHAFMEPDGRISVLTYPDHERPSAPPNPTA